MVYRGAVLVVISDCPMCPQALSQGPVVPLLQQVFGKSLQVFVFQITFFVFKQCQCARACIHGVCVGVCMHALMFWLFIHIHMCVGMY